MKKARETNKILIWVWIYIFIFPITIIYFAVDYERIRRVGSEELVEVKDVESIGSRPRKPRTYLHTLMGTQEYRVYLYEKMEIGSKIWILGTPNVGHGVKETIVGRKTDSMFALFYKNTPGIIMIGFVLVVCFWIYCVYWLVRRIRTF